MIILNKKRLLLISSFVFVSLIACTINSVQSPNTVQTVALPVSNKVIVIDAGHGVPDERSPEQQGNY